MGQGTPVEAYAPEIQQKGLCPNFTRFKILVPWIPSTDGSSCLPLPPRSFTYNKHVHKNARLNAKLFLPISLLFLGTAGPHYIHKRLQSYTGIKTIVSSVNKCLTVLKITQSLIHLLFLLFNKAQLVSSHSFSLSTAS